MTEQHGEPGNGLRPSEPELLFNRRWRELVGKAGGQARVVNRLGWSSSTVSRDYRGDIPPSDGRLRELCDFLGLSGPERDEMARLLGRARQAREERKRTTRLAVTAGTHLVTAGTGQAPGGGPSSPGTAAPEPASPGAGPAGPPPAPADGTWPRTGGRWKAVALTGAGVLAGVLLATAALLAWEPWQGTAQPAGAATGVPVARGTFPGMPMKAITIARQSLTPALASAFGHGRKAGSGTVDGYVFRNVKGPALCLTAASAGHAAGQDGDQVEVAACDGAASQVWIPEQWEASGSRFTWLVNDRYQSKCLNASNIGGLGNGHRTMLWNCYQSPNEYWDFGDWFTNVKTSGHAYPIFVESARLCLDADKFDFRDGTHVNIWDQYPTANQFWS